MGPEISGLQFGQASASPGETVTLSFVISEAVAGNPYVFINGHGATFVSELGGTYTYSFEVHPGGGGPAPADVHIGASDALGNAGTLDDSSTLILNFPAMPAPVWVLTALMLALGAIVTWRLRRAGKIALFMALFAVQAAHGQPPVVSNVHFVQQAKAGGGTEVVITYDLVSELCNCNIEVSLSKNAGADGFPFPVTSISGDIEHVAPGAGNRIVWDVAADYPGEMISQAQLRVTAVTRPDDLTQWGVGFRSAYVASKSAYCQNNLKYMGLVFKIFASPQTGEFWPRLSSERGKLMFTEAEVDSTCLMPYPELLLCPGRADKPPVPPYDDTHYIYLGYAVGNDQDVLTFAAAYEAHAAAGGDFSGNLPGVTSIGNAVFRLRESISSPIPQSKIPVMLDWPDNHQQGFGGNVLFMDGHVEFIEYPLRFPMTETTIGALAALAGYEPPTAWSTLDLDSPFPPSLDPNGFTAKCGNNLKQLGLSMRIFANENWPTEEFPLLADTDGLLMVALDELYPEFLQNPNVLICPGVASLPVTPHFDDNDYAYLGYFVQNDSDVVAFVEAYRTEIEDGGDFAGSLPAVTSYGNSFLRLYDSVGLVLEDPNDGPFGTGCVGGHAIPVAIEWPDNHEGLSGGNVLYLDGHVEWKPYPGEFPMTEATITALSELAGRTPTVTYAQADPAYTLENDPYRLVKECKNRLMGASLSAWIYASEQADDKWPRLSASPGKLMMRESDIVPDYLFDPAELICPGPQPVIPEPFIDDIHYIYFGYVMTSDADVQAFAQAYATEVANGGDFSADLPAVTSYGNSLIRLVEGALNPWNVPEENFVGDHEIPVMMEWPGQHEGLNGGHVIYLDGHTEFIEYPGKFPMTEATITTFDSIAGWQRITAWATKDFTPEHDPHLQALCQTNLKSIGISFKIFAGIRSGEFYPRLSSTAGKLTFDPDRFVPFHLDQLIRLSCPASPYACATPALDDQSYCYPGYVLLTDGDVAAFAAAYQVEQSIAGGFENNLPAVTSYGNALVHLGEGAANSFSPAPHNLYSYDHKIPVLIEWPDNHDDLRGGNVLYMDGHVEWIEYPGKFPMTVATMNILTNLAGRPPIQ